MTYEEKLSIIISALREAQNATRKEHYTSLYLTKDNRLTEIDPNELHDILLKLQDDEKVITIKDIPTKLKPVFEQTDDALEGELLRISMRKNEKSIGQNKRKSARRLPN